MCKGIWHAIGNQVTWKTEAGESLEPWIQEFKTSLDHPVSNFKNKIKVILDANVNMVLITKWGMWWSWENDFIIAYKKSCKSCVDNRKIDSLKSPHPSTLLSSSVLYVMSFGSYMHFIGWISLFWRQGFSVLPVLPRLPQVSDPPASASWDTGSPSGYSHIRPGSCELQWLAYP